MIDYNDLISFHGHSCPGLAIGYRMTTAAMNFLAQNQAEDEELVAIVENDACGVDALQFISGCTFGKGNLIFRDYGKQVYTLYSRQSGKGVRVAFTDTNAPAGIRQDRQKFIDWLKGAAESDIVMLTPVTIPEPPKARIRQSVVCERCGEMVMETRVRDAAGRLLCIPCADQS